MSMPELAYCRTLLVRVAMLPLLAMTSAQAGDQRPSIPRLGEKISHADAARWDMTIFPDGKGLPAGQGTVVRGRTLFSQLCAHCNGEQGQGATAEELAGGVVPLTGDPPDKTVGLYWPYATTLFDFIQRAMPLDAPGSLQSDDVYALTAYLLYLNQIIDEKKLLNAKTLPNVTMPNRSGFVSVDAP